MDWQPIETAPKDGTLILLYPTKGDGQINTGYWWAHAKCWGAAGAWFDDGEVSHWMPLPDPPKEVNDGHSQLSRA